MGLLGHSFSAYYLSSVCTNMPMSSRLFPGGLEAWRPPLLFGQFYTWLFTKGGVSSTPAPSPLFCPGLSVFLLE